MLIYGHQGISGSKIPITDCLKFSSFAAYNFQEDKRKEVDRDNDGEEERANHLGCWSASSPAKAWSALLWASSFFQLQDDNFVMTDWTHVGEAERVDRRREQIFWAQGPMEQFVKVSTLGQQWHRLFGRYLSGNNRSKQGPFWMNLKECVLNFRSAYRRWIPFLNHKFKLRCPGVNCIVTRDWMVFYLGSSDRVLSWMVSDGHTKGCSQNSFAK